MAAPKMNVTELDFFQIKANLKTFFEAKPEFSDYDFDGSGLSTLLDIMAYTVHYMGVYSNAAFNENFLDAAILRSSAVSRAKELGYFPGQNSSASANIKISISGQTPGRAAINVPSGTQFTSSKDNVSFTFKTKQNYTLTETDPGVFENSSIEIVEGRDGQQTYTWAIADPSPILINQKNITIDNMTVKVDGVTFVNATSLKNLTQFSKVYFLEENADGKIKMYFGDDVFGESLVDGASIVIDYVVTKKEQGNGCSKFSLVDSIDSLSSSLFNITTLDNASGGGSQETIESIKRNAPRLYTAQDRGVTDSDWNALVSKQFTWIDSMNIWGGEDNDPPFYGRVFFSIKPNYGTTMSQVKKDQVISYLKQKRVLGITPVIVDPEFVYIDVTTNFTWDKDVTTLSYSQLETKVSGAITTYFNNNAKNFDSSFKFSSFVAAIDAADNSIVSNDTTIQISKKITPITTSAINYLINFNNALKPGTVLSDTWNGNGTNNTYYFKDDGLGVLTLYANGVAQKETHTVDYTTGKINLLSIFVDIDPEDHIIFRATPLIKDIFPIRNQLLTSGKIAVSSTVYTGSN